MKKARMVTSLCTGFFLIFCLVEGLEGKKIILNNALVPQQVDFPKSMTSGFIQSRMNDYERQGRGRKPVGNKTYALGTNLTVSHDRDYKGLFSVVFAAYSNHLSLVTSPEDWWLIITQKVAGALDNNSHKKSVRNHFVGHEGKKELGVEINKIGDIEEEWFFSQMTQQVQDNIKDPGYVSNMQPNFSTTTSLHGIVGNIAIMSSLQEYFEYTGFITCGIPSIEMKGKLTDWEWLVAKFVSLRNRLAPISEDLGLSGWWSGAEEVLEKLVDTYNGAPDTVWWDQIVQKREIDVVCGFAEVWDGWFLQDFLNQTVEEVQSSLVSVPFSIDDNGTKTQAALVAGIAGFTHDIVENTVEAQHAWNLMLEPDSYLRTK